VLNGIFSRFRTGAPLFQPLVAGEPYGTGCWKGVSKVHDGDIQMIDPSSIRVHHRAAKR